MGAFRRVRDVAGGLRSEGPIWLPIFAAFGIELCRIRALT
jgi:hypothetical protein